MDVVVGTVDMAVGTADMVVGTADMGTSDPRTADQDNTTRR